MEPASDSGSSPDFDIFISYKSEDATGARAVADALIARGARVWFAEYEVLPDNYQAFDSLLTAALERDAAGDHAPSPLSQAIERSRFVLAITSERWLGSRFCQMEIEHALTRISSTDGASVVLLAKQDIPRLYDRYPRLRSAPTFPFAGAFDNSLSFVLEKAALGPRRPVFDVSLPTVRRRHDFPFGLTVDLDDFVPAPHSAGRLQRFEGSIEGMRAEFAIALSPFRNSLGQLSILETGNEDDRAAYRRYLDVARQWSVRDGYEVHGLHLFFWSGRSHLAMTTRAKAGPGDNRWQRRYVLVLTAPNVASVGELEMTFTIDLPSGSTAESRRVMCALAPRLDSMARSVSYWPEEDIRRETSRSRLVDAAILGACFVGAAALASPWAKTVIVSTAAAVATGSVARVVSHSVHEAYLSTVHHLPTASMGRNESTAGFFVASVGFAIAFLLRGSLTAAGTVTWASAIVLGVSSHRFWTIATALVVARGALHAHRAVPHRTLLRQWVGGTPTLHLDGSLKTLLSASSLAWKRPRLARLKDAASTAGLVDRLLVELRRRDARPFNGAIEIAFMGLAPAAALVSVGSSGLAAVVACTAGAVALVAWGVAWRNAVPPAVRGALEVAHERPSATHVEKVARAYLDVSRAHGGGRRWSRAIQWAAAAWQISSTPARRLIFAQITLEAATGPDTLAKHVSREDLLFVGAAAAAGLEDDPQVGAAASELLRSLPQPCAS